MRRSAFRLLAAVTVAASALLVAPGTALAWYPGGFDKNLSCDLAPRPGATMTLAQSGEPPLGHQEPGSRSRTVHDSPSYTEKESTVRRASEFQVVSVTPCNGGQTNARLKYSAYECQTTSTVVNKVGDSSRPVVMPNNPSTGPWQPC